MMREQQPNKRLQLRSESVWMIQRSMPEDNKTPVEIVVALMVLVMVVALVVLYPITYA